MNTLSSHIHDLPRETHRMISVVSPMTGEVHQLHLSAPGVSIQNVIIGKVSAGFTRGRPLETTGPAYQLLSRRWILRGQEIEVFVGNNSGKDLMVRLHVEVVPGPIPADSPDGEPTRYRNPGSDLDRHLASFRRSS